MQTGSAHQGPDSARDQRAGTTPAGWVCARVRVLEPRFLAALALLVAGAAMVLWPVLPASWALVLIPLLAARWARAGAPCHVRELALRGCLLVTGVLLLQWHEQADAETVALLTQVWLAAACAAYAFLLPAAWAAGLAVVALFTMAAAQLLASGELPDSASALAGALSIALPALLVAGPGAALRRAGARRESAWFDAATGLFNEDGLAARGGELLASCQRHGQPLTLAVFACGDLLEVRQICGPHVAGRVGLRLAARLIRVAGRRGMVARTGLTEFTILLPARDAARALRDIQRVLGSPSRVEYESGRDEIVLLPELALVHAGPGQDLVALREAARRQLASTRAREARRQRHLHRAHERHSQPIALDSARAARERALARTVPMPLGAS